VHEDEDAEIVAVNVIEVPDQTSLSQELVFEEERVERQRDLLDNARDIAADLDIGLRTRAIVGRNAGEVILNVIDEESADHVVIGWKGTRSRRDQVLGSTIDPIIGRAPCDTTLVKLGPEGGRSVGEIVALAGEGPYAPVAARRAAEFVTASGEESSLTLLNVQRPFDEAQEEEFSSPEESGKALIEDFVERAGIESVSYETRVVVAEDVGQAVLDTVDEYDTVCVGATRSGSISQTVFGSLPERVGEEFDGTVVIARGPNESPMSIREAVLQRLEM
jgi:nucleotide-binding universal stress UspA family protein